MEWAKLHLAEAAQRQRDGLEMVTRLMMLQSGQSAGQDAGDALSIAACRVMAISRLHDHLQSDSADECVEFRAYLRQHCQSVAGALASGRGARPRIVVTGPELRIATKVAMPLALCVNELLMDAPNFGQVDILIELSRRGEREIAICVSHNTVQKAFLLTRQPVASGKVDILSSILKTIGGQIFPGTTANGRIVKNTILAPASVAANEAVVVAARASAA
jgi:two-component sensor histidine kinase